MGLKRILVILLVATLVAGLFQLSVANGENDIQLGENVEWVTLESVSFDPEDEVEWEGSASIETVEGDSHLVCDGLTQLFWQGAWKDVRVELKVQLGSGGFGIAVRGTESGEIEFGTQRDYFLLTRPGARFQELDHNPQLDGSHWYSVVFVVVGDQLSVEVDGELWFAIQDDDPLLTPGRIRVVANPTDEPILIDDICIQYAQERLSTEEVLPALSTWEVAFEEDFEENWDPASIAGQLDGSAWEHVFDGENGALRVECNCWVEIPESGAGEDYALTTRVRIDHGGATLSFRQGDEGRYFIGIEEGRLFLGKEQPWGHRVTLATAPFPIALEEWYDVMIVGSGSELFVFLDGLIQIRYVDDSAPILAGGTNYETCGNRPILLIDRITIRAVSGEYPQKCQDPQAFLGIGYSYRGEGNFELAYESFISALELFRAEEDRQGEAEALLCLGNTLVSLGDVPAAIEQFHLALEIFIEIGDRASEAWCHLDIGNAHMQLEELTTALEHFETARASFVALSDREGEIEALRSGGHCLLALADGFMSADPTEAISIVQRSLRAFRDAEDEQGEANALMMLGNLHQSVSRYAEALDYAEQAESLFQSIGDRLSATWALNLRSSCHYGLSEYEQSLELGERALNNFRSLGEVEGEASALVTLSCFYETRGEFQQSIDYCLTALGIYREIGQMDSAAGTLQRLGAYYSQVGDTELAAECRKQALDLARALDVPWLLANGLMSAGQSLIDQGDLSAAVVPLEEALGVYREIDSLNGEADCLAPLLDCYMFLGRLHEALECAESIVTIGREIGDLRIECNGLMSLGNVHLQLGQIEKGIDFLERSLQIAKDIGALTMEVGLHRQLAGYYQSLGRLEDARTHYESAIEGTERTFSDLTIESLQEAFFPRVRELYVEYFMFLLAMDDVDETLWVAERCRARTYVEQVGQADIDLLDLLPESGIRSGVISAEQVEQDAREAIDNLPTNTAAIEYFVTDGQTFVWVLRDGAIYGPRQIDVSKVELQRRVVEFRTSIEAASQGMSSRPDDELLVMARNLHQLLVAHIAEWLEEIDHIVIVPSGPLYYLPFASLLECPECVGIDFLGGEYLVERYSISYTPSLSTLHFIQQRQPVGQEEPNLLALADPVSTDSSLPRLPEAQEEAQAIALLFNESEIFVDEAATEDALRKSVADAGHLLLSTHGWFDAGNPMYSYLMLTPTATSDGRLHTYEVFELPLQAELVTLSACETLLPALDVARETERTVRGVSDEVPITLSDEQLNELTTGDDVVGLTRAFLYAGSSSVLSTLWRVVSETTEQLIVALYGYMEEGMDKAEALRRAQLDVMAVYPHPRYWAAFNLMGDWQAQFDPAPESTSKLSPQLLEKLEEWGATGPSDSATTIVVLVILREEISEELVQRITSLSENIEVQGGFGHFVQLEVPFSVLYVLSRLAEVEQITEQPTMSTTP